MSGRPRHSWLPTSELTGRDTALTVSRRHDGWRDRVSDRRTFILLQLEGLPRPLTGEQACELMARLMPPYNLVARWQLYTCSGSTFGAIWRAPGRSAHTGSQMGASEC
jgi:hypothetical protein